MDTSLVVREMCLLYWGRYLVPCTAVLGHIASPRLIDFKTAMA